MTNRFKSSPEYDLMTEYPHQHSTRTDTAPRMARDSTYTPESRQPPATSIIIITRLGYISHSWTWLSVIIVARIYFHPPVITIWTGALVRN